MFVLVVLATVCLASSPALAANEKPFYELENVEDLFNDFIEEHNKVYINRIEYLERLEIFKATLKDINERNAKFPDTVFAVNHFADLKPHELQQYRGFKAPNETAKVMVIPKEWKSDAASYDWRKHNAVTHVKNQGRCGSCFIFSAVGEIEGQYAIKHQQCVALSEGQALDCLDAGSCGGGWMEWVMNELAQKSMKLAQEGDYDAYDANKTVCNYDPSKGLVQSLGGKRFTQMDEEQLKALLLQHGPLSIAINADDCQYYQGGILEPNHCIGQPIDHAVLIVGFGEEGGKKFWIIKNSWGTVWGEQGYVRLKRGVNACGLGKEVATSTVA